MSSDNETWLIAAGDSVIERKAALPAASISDLEQLIYCVWVADYGMRNAGDLETARDVYGAFQEVGARLAKSLDLPKTHAALALPSAVLEQQYFDRFHAMCDELRSAATDQTHLT